MKNYLITILFIINISIHHITFFNHAALTLDYLAPFSCIDIKIIIVIQFLHINYTGDIMDNKQKLFFLIDTAYNKFDQTHDQLKQNLFNCAVAMNEDVEFDEVVTKTYLILRKLPAEDRINIPELKALTEYVAPIYNKLDAKARRKGALGGGIIIVGGI
jgi:hypothetical protein